MDELLTVDEAREILRIGRCKAYAMVKAGEIPCLRFGKHIRIPRKAITEMIEKAASA